MKLKDLPKYKKNKNCFFFACGPSINNLTQDQYYKIKENNDVWGINNLYYHSFISPDFYASYLDPQEYDLYLHYMKVHEHLYKNTIFVTMNEGAYNVIPDKFLKCLYSRNFVKSKAFAGEVKDNSITVSMKYECTGITYALLLLDFLNYETINVLGVDLYTSKYFWYNSDKEVFNRFNTELGNDPDIPYLHWKRITNYFRLFYNSKMLPTNKKMFNYSKKSYLQGIIPYKSLEDI